MGLVAYGARAGREGAAARPATIERNGLQLLVARAFLDEARAVAVRAAIGRFD